jgi:hypothetical protein
MKQSKGGCIDPNWILLDNQSTVDVFYNRRLLKDIREVDTWIDIHCNAGVTSTNLQGELPGYGTVWYHKDGIANILSLSKAAARHHVTYDIVDRNKFRVHKDDGTRRVFEQSGRGLFSMDTQSGDTGTTLVNTVAENKSRYTNRDYSRAELARRLQAWLPAAVESNQLQNCPVECDDIAAAEDIFGPEMIGILKGKTVRRGGEHVRPTNVTIPAQIVSRYQKVTIAVDIMKVNKIPFMISIYRSIKFGTSEMIPNMKATIVEI